MLIRYPPSLLPQLALRMSGQHWKQASYSAAFLPAGVCVATGGIPAAGLSRSRMAWGEDPDRGEDHAAKHRRAGIATPANARTDRPQHARTRGGSRERSSRPVSSSIVTVFIGTPNPCG